MASGLHLPPGSAPQKLMGAWGSTDADLVKTRSCPFTSVMMLIPMGVGPAGAQMALGAQYAPCTRKCGVFEPDEHDTPEKASGSCGFKGLRGLLGQVVAKLQEDLAARPEIEDNQAL